MNRPIASVVIPARNEEAVIGRCLRALLDGAHPGELEVVVVCNGCRDGTVDVIRSVAPNVTIVDLPESSKVGALNAGDDSVHTYPRFYVDADIELSIESLRRVADALTSEDVACAAPSPRFALDDRKWSIRQFYAIWQQLPYLKGQMIGSGVYALSAEGRSRFDRFPNLTADDQFVMQRFLPTERQCLSHSFFTVHPPTTLGGLVRMRTRAYRGNMELAGSGLAVTGAPGGAGRALLRLARRPKLLPGIATFVAVNGIAKVRAHHASASGSAAWERDDSARAVAR